MTTPERSVEEMKKQFREKWEGTNLQNQAISTPMMNEMFADIETILQAERQKREEMMERIKMTADDVWKVGDHYWGGDYEPSHYELTMLAESYNDIMERKLTQTNNPK